MPAPRHPGWDGPVYGDPGFDPLTAPAEALGLPGRRPGPAVPAAPAPPAAARDSRGLRGGQASASWPCSACGRANPLTAGVCGACGSAFLSGVRKAEGPLLALPVVGDITRLQRSQRLGLAFVVMFVIVVLTALLGLLLS